MVKQRSVDEYLGFAQNRTRKADPAPEPADTAVDDDAYLDSWYQVLKAKADETDEGTAAEG